MFLIVSVGPIEKQKWTNFISLILNKRIWQMNGTVKAMQMENVTGTPR